MRYECFYNHELEIAEVVTHGVATLAEMTDMMHSIAELCFKENIANFIVDISELDVTQLTIEHIREMSEVVAFLEEKVRGRRCAVVAVRDVQFGMVRAWETMTGMKNIIDFKTMAFRSREHAMDWLKGT